jgi:probable O-glycosylation ligase (exosortase A-associated)
MNGLIFTYSLAWGGAVASLFRPFVGLLIYIAFAILKPDALWPWSVPQGNYSRIVGIALLVGWALNGLGSWNLGKARGAILAITGFMIWCVLSAMQAPDQDKAWDFVDNMLKIVLPIVVGITLIDSVAQLKQLAWVIVLSQAFLAYEANLSYFGGNNVVRLYGFAGLPDNNGVALTMHTCAIVAFFLGLHSPGWWRKIVAFAAAGLMVHAVLFSFSREGMLGLLVTAAVAFLLIPKRPRNFLVFTLAVVAALSLAGAEVRERFASIFIDPEERDRSAESRLQLWADCYDAMTRKPILGHGPAHFPLVSQEYGWPEGKQGHTLWLQIGAELGVPGLAFLLGFYGLCALRLWPVARSRDATRDPWLADGARMVVASLAGFFVCTQFNNLYLIEVPYYVALLGAGVLKISSTAAPEAAVTSSAMSASQEPFSGNEPAAPPPKAF